jgi:hypothetical protein
MRWRTVSGTCDSIRERRARESWENGWEEEEDFEEKTTQVTAVTIGMLVAQVFIHPEEASGFIEKFLTKRLDLRYLEWNGRKDVKFLGVC